MSKSNKILNKYILCLHNTENYTKDYNKNIESMKIKLNKIKELISDQIFLYPLDNIIDLINIRENTIDFLKSGIDQVNVYNVITDQSERLVIKYNLSNRNYKFYTSSKEVNAELEIERDGKSFKKYDLFKEFNPLNFIRLQKEFILDNYVSLFFKDTDIKLGMILVAYYYLIRFVIQGLNEEERVCILDRNNVPELNKIFSNICK